MIAIRCIYLCHSKINCPLKTTATPAFRLRKIGLLTIAAVYLLILVGGIVRSTGAGMGCPDWPKCFGQWVPPTNVSQLPDNYLEIYQSKRLAKNEKIAAYLKVLGFEAAANQILNEQFIQEETPFNAVKTWIEYVNRLIGVVIGLLIILTFYHSLAYRASDFTVTALAFFSVVLVVFQGWIGSIVVSTNLLTWMVSVHMLLALLLVAVLIYTITRSYSQLLEEVAQNRKRASVWLLVALVLSVIQILMGTQVRESIDQLAMQYGFDNRTEWMPNIDAVFYIHRSFSLLLLGANGALLYSLRSTLLEHSQIRNTAIILVAVITVEIVSGIIMAYFEVPPLMQPIHLLLANIMFGVQFYMLMLVNASYFFGKKARTSIRKNELV